MWRAHADLILPPGGRWPGREDGRRAAGPTLPRRPARRPRRSTSRSEAERWPSRSTVVSTCWSMAKASRLSATSEGESVRVPGRPGRQRRGRHIRPRRGAGSAEGAGHARAGQGPRQDQGRRAEGRPGGQGQTPTDRSPRPSRRRPRPSTARQPSRRRDPTRPRLPVLPRPLPRQRRMLPGRAPRDRPARRASRATPPRRSRSRRARVPTSRRLARRRGRWPTGTANRAPGGRRRSRRGSVVSQRSARSALCTLAAAVLVAALAGPAAAQDTRVSIGSPTSPFSQNKQNEPAVAIDPSDPNVVVAGANDNIDMEACNAGARQRLPLHRGRRRLRRLLLVELRPELDPADLHRPERPRLPRRARPRCRAARRRPGPIGTLPNYAENDLVSDGDPAVAFGPQPTAGGRLLLCERVAPVLRQPDLGAPRRRAVQGRRGDRGLAHRQRRGRGERQQRGVERSGDRQPPDLGAVLRQGAGVGRQRRVEPVLRQRLRLLRRLPRQRQRRPPTSRSTC